MVTNHETRLTSAELAGLWGLYQKDTASRGVIKHFLATVTDKDVQSVLEKAFLSFDKQVESITNLFQAEQIPIPVGFTEQDFHLNAPSLFSDPFALLYLNNLGTLGMAANSLSISLASRSDIVVLHKKFLSEAVDLETTAKETLQEKGLWLRPPYIPKPKAVNFVTKQSFLGKVAGDQRPLSSIEITHLFLNAQTNFIGQQLMTGKSQVAKDEKVIQYLVRGIKMSDKHVRIFSDLLLSNDIPAPMTWDSSVTDSTEAPYSDKLILFHITSMVAAGIANYGAAIAASPRRDIGLKYARLLTEISLYAEDGANLMIEKGWLEEPPMAPDRKQLRKKG